MSEYEISTCDRKIKNCPCTHQPHWPASKNTPCSGSTDTPLPAESRAADPRTCEGAHSHASSMSSGAGEQKTPTCGTSSRPAKNRTRRCRSMRRSKVSRKGGTVKQSCPPLQLRSLMTGPGADVIPGGASRAETLGEQLRAQLRNPHAEGALLWRARHTQQSTAPTHSTPKGEPDSTPRRAVTWDRYEATSNACPADTQHPLQPEGTHPARSHADPHHDDGRNPSWRTEGDSQSATQAEAHHDSRSRPGWSSNPGARDGGHEDEYRGTFESKDTDDSAPPQREEIRNRRQEPLEKTFIASTQTTEGVTKTTPWFWQFKSNSMWTRRWKMTTFPTPG